MEWHREAAMTVQSLGYLGIRAKDLGDWSSYGTNLLGLQRIDRSRSSIAFRMDDRKQRLVVEADGGEGIGFFGWEAADAAALDATGVRIRSATGSRSSTAPRPPTTRSCLAARSLAFAPGRWGSGTL
jgi:hypothetical protein